jgi:hypothetical protein
LIIACIELSPHLRLVWKMTEEVGVTENSATVCRRSATGAEDAAIEEHTGANIDSIPRKSES